MQEDFGRRKKIAILGGGMSALTTAFELTSPANPHHREFDVTIYQLGWRLGGKAQSGRSMEEEYSYRIEEDGLHVFYGCYDNAFSIMQACYQELQRSPDAPLAHWQAAFRPHSFVNYYQKFLDKWRAIEINFATNLLLPGKGLRLKGLADFFAPALERLRSLYAGTAASRAADPEDRDKLRSSFVELVEDLAGVNPKRDTVSWNFKGQMLDAAQQLADWIAFDRGSLSLWLVHRRTAVAKELDVAVDAGGPGAVWDPVEKGLKLLCRILHKFLELLWELIKSSAGSDFVVFKDWVRINWAVGNICGVIRDDLVKKGLLAVNDQDYRAWLAKYIVDDDGLTLNSVIVTQIYSGTFNYKDGDPRYPRMEAGTTLMALVRVLLAYKGAYSYKMQAGTGDVVFAPLYEVLKRRGVRFEFFSQVQDIKLSADWERIEAIEIGRQARTIDPRKPYEPLILVKGLPCWPASPLYEQLQDGDALRGVDLEAYADKWDAGTVTLRYGRDFDAVVLGLGIGALHRVFPEILDERHSHKPDVTRKWKAMVAAVTTVRTQSFQIWLKKTLNKLGCETPPPLATGYNVTPLNSYSDMSQYIAWEGWPAGGDKYPLSQFLLCGALEDFPENPVKQNALAFLRRYAGFLWPEATKPPGQEDAPLDWDLLVDNRARPGYGEARFDSQFWWLTPNVSNRYVQVPPGSSRHRLAANQSGIGNLYLTGDWIDNTFFTGCIEGATMSGMSTSHAVCGYPELSSIAWWGFGGPGKP